MLAHYLLGCVYRDLDSIPLALQCYEDAAEMADTTDEDCDYATLSRIYGQSSELFSKEWMSQNILTSSRMCYKYAMKVKDTLTALIHIIQAQKLTTYLKNPINKLRYAKLYQNYISCTAIKTMQQWL